MEAFASLAVIIGFTSAFALTVMYLLNVRCIEKRLESTHKQAWADLGSPHVIMNNSIRNSSRILQWIKKNEWLKLNDHKLESFIKKHKTYRVGLVISWLLFSSGMLLGFFATQ